MFRKVSICFQTLTREEKITVQEIYKYFAVDYAPVYLSDMFGSKVNLSDMVSLIVAQISKTPDNYLKLSQEDSSFESFLLEALDNSSNISDQKLILKENFKVFKNVPFILLFLHIVMNFYELNLITTSSSKPQLNVKNSCINGK